MSSSGRPVPAQSGSGVTVLTFDQPGTLATGTGKGRIRVPTATTIVSVAAVANTAPTGASIKVDVNKNGTTIFTTQANRPAIAISGFASSDAIPDVTALAAGDYLTVDIDQVGSSVAGADLTVIVEVVMAAPNGSAPSGVSPHTHVIADVTGLQAALDAKLIAASNLSDLASAATARTNLGLGTAATQASSAFDAAGAATAAAAASVPKSTVTAAADLIVGTGNGTVGRLGKGTDGQVLTVDPTTHLLVWATPSAGGGGSNNATPSPSVGGYSLWSYDSAALTGAAESPIAGVVELMRLDCPAQVTLTKFTTMLAQLASSEAANVFQGIYVYDGSANLVLVGKTADVATDYKNNFGPDPHTLTAEAGQSLTIPAASVVYGAILMGTQGATLAQLYKTTVNGPNQNGATATNLKRAVKFGTGRTALPATIAVSSLAANTFMWWMAAV